MTDRSTSRGKEKKAHLLREKRPLRVVSRNGFALRLCLSSQRGPKQGYAGVREDGPQVPTLPTSWTARISLASARQYKPR